MKVSAQKLDPFNVVPLVQLLVDGVSTVCRATHWQEEDVLSSGLFEREGDGDTEGTMLA